VVDTPTGWKRIDNAPIGIDLCVCIKDAFGLYPLPFPCRKRKSGWANARQGVSLRIKPLGWIEWEKRRVLIKWTKHFT
jgi:hypothetical protein